MKKQISPLILKGGVGVKCSTKHGATEKFVNNKQIYREKKEQ